MCFFMRVINKKMVFTNISKKIALRSENILSILIEKVEIFLSCLYGGNKNEISL